MRPREALLSPPDSDSDSGRGFFMPVEIFTVWQPTVCRPYVSRRSVRESGWWVMQLRLCDAMLGDGVRIVFCVLSCKWPNIGWNNFERGHVVCVEDAFEARIGVHVPQ